MLELIKSIGQTITPQMALGIFGFCATVLCGGLAGAIYSSRYFAKRFKTEISMKFISEEFVRVEEVEEAIKILRDITYQTETMNADGGSTISANREQFGKVRVSPR